MTKDDKQFISGLINGLKQEITGFESRLSKKITGLDGKIDGVESRLGEKIRHNGVMIEDLRDVVYSVADNVSDLNRRMKTIETDVTDIKEAIHDYPILRETVKKHSRQLAKLQK